MCFCSSDMLLPKIIIFIKTNLTKSNGQTSIDKYRITTIIEDRRYLGFFKYKFEIYRTFINEKSYLSRKYKDEQNDHK